MRDAAHVHTLHFVYSVVVCREIKAIRDSCCNQAISRFDRWSLSAMGMLQQSRKAEYSTGMRRTVLPLLLLLFAIVLAAQTASDLAIRYGDPDIDDACEPDHRF